MEPLTAGFISWSRNSVRERVSIIDSEPFNDGMMDGTHYSKKEMYSMRGKIAFMIPSDISAIGVRKLSTELSAGRVPVMAKDNGVVLAKWGKNARDAMEKGLSAREIYLDKIPAAHIRELPDPTTRIAQLWNWTLAKKGRRVTDGAVKKIMKELKLEKRHNRIIDRVTEKDLGPIEEGETEDKKGNWCLKQNRGWNRISGWFGYWEKLWCKTRAYVNYPACSGNRKLVDYIVAEVDGPQHYAWNSRYNASIAYTYDWDYIWVGQSHCGTAYSYGRKGSGSASITRRIC
jgi:hypothetical protein